MEEWCLLQPKIELHAHLNGSVRDSTLLELARNLAEKGVLVFADVEHVILKDDRSLVECFKLFDLIHVLTTDHATVTRITKEVVEDFASENVVYVELRTTPKKNAAIGMTKRSYMEAVINGLRSVEAVDVDFIPSKMGQKNSTMNLSTDDMCNGTARKKIYVRLLLSIDRRETTAAAMETVQLALEMRDVGVVGIDLSGNPIIGEWVTFLPALKYAKEQGLLVTLHCGEVPDRKEEVNAMLDFLPQRIGHACFIHGEEWIKLKSSKIPVEICLTSNIRTDRFPSIEYHHFVDLYKSKHPVVLCTDDVGMFSTSLSKEYNLAASAFGLGKEEMFQLARDATEFVFADDDVKKNLREIFDSAEKKFML
ncbi:Adenosine/AMP deaminase domain [Macleaya cordata]|uniref:Adenosine/AMP deaminase domain n=1 Tax=Macleaya cordata TaxID=56857 RepID=A0A200QJ80_MACCD|nr:Adenosine/AMP deaminase domain [Macleaya cordata]